MKSYQFSRRSFLSLVGASAGLHALLRNVEARADGATSPPRLLLVHHPVGTIYNAWLCAGGMSDFSFSQVLAPFEDAGLRSDLSVLDGLSMDMISGPGGGHEKGTVIMTTGSPTRFTRTGQSETDDPHADGPSIEQLLLSQVTSLSGAPIQSLQASCDDRIDHQEISTRCISYSTQRRAIQAVQGPGEENIPLRPTLKPLDLYTRVFGAMMPGGVDPEALAKNLRAKKSVLDFSLRELARLRLLAPASQKSLIDAHEQAIRDMENEIQGLLAANHDAVSCGVLAPPPNVQGGVDDNKDHDNTQNPTATKADDPLHLQIGQLHQSIIVAAFRCDLTRVASFQWSPGTNHIAFANMWPENSKGIYQHHPVSHNVAGGDFDKPAGSRTPQVQFLINVDRWYSTHSAELVAKLKVTQDVYGNSLLDNTIVPYITEVGRADHTRTNIPVLLLGGKNLGLKHGKFLRLAKDRPHNDLWLSVARAFGVTLDQLKGQRGVAYDSKTYTGAINELFT